ncbi:MAG: NUDIX domain-containing protein [Rhodocyclaceae bacterium]
MMLTFRSAGGVFNCRAAAVVLRGNALLVTQEAGSPFWYLPGGRVEFGESAAQSAVRALHEDLGVVGQVVRPLYFVENFFALSDGRPFHEWSMYFLAEIGPDAVPRTRDLNGIQSHADLRFRWAELDTLGKLPLRPNFLCESLKHLPDTLEHVVYRDVPALHPERW